MELNNLQKRIVLGKPFGFTMVKGGSCTGKTTVASYRALYLKNSYCLYEDEKVLLITGEKNGYNKLKDNFNQAESLNFYDFGTLFSTRKENSIKITSIDDVVDGYYKQYVVENNLEIKLINREKKVHIIEECIELLKPQYKKVKFLCKEYKDFLIDELEWIKSCNYISMDLYQKAERIGRSSNTIKGPKRLNKGSFSREAIFILLQFYNYKLYENGLIDKEDKLRLALKQINKYNKGKYTHMVVDGAESLSKLHLDILMALRNSKAYSSFMILVNPKTSANSTSWIVKGRRQKNLDLPGVVKNCLLKKRYGYLDICTDKNDFKINKDFLEKYEYIDIRHNTRFQILRDSSKIGELVIKQGDDEQICQNDQLKELPVFSNIAAGEPILINPEIWDTFYIPKYWIKGVKDSFMLKVKGDSMIGAGIEDEDFVVVRKQSIAGNRDIVAVDLDGNATLKRLWINGKEALLLPENENYEPIEIKDREISIIGIVIGVIKSI